MAGGVHNSRNSTGSAPCFILRSTTPILPGSDPCEYRTGCYNCAFPKRDRHHATAGYRSVLITRAYVLSRIYTRIRRVGVGRFLYLSDFSEIQTSFVRPKGT